MLYSVVENIGKNFVLFLKRVFPFWGTYPLGVGIMSLVGVCLFLCMSLPIAGSIYHFLSCLFFHSILQKRWKIFLQKLDIPG